MLKCTATLFAGVAALLLAACQVPSTDSSQSRGGNAEPLADDPSLDENNPCAVNLHRIVEALLLYYSQHQRLPATLEELPRKTLEGDSYSLTCPATGKPYLYFAQGLAPPEHIIVSGVRLILYDAQPAHQRIVHMTDIQGDSEVKQKVRLGIVMVPKTTRSAGNTMTSEGGVQLSVVPIEQNLLDVYLNAAKNPPGMQIRTFPPGQ